MVYFFRLNVYLSMVVVSYFTIEPNLFTPAPLLRRSTHFGRVPVTNAKIVSDYFLMCRPLKMLVYILNLIYPQPCISASKINTLQQIPSKPTHQFPLKYKNPIPHFKPFRADSLKTVNAGYVTPFSLKVN